MRFWVWLGACALLGCSGGSGGSDSGLGAPPIYAVPGCESIEAAPCDVRTRACQERLLALAACLREDQPGSLPPVTVMTEQQFADYLTGQLAEQDPPPDPNHYERALTLLRLALPGDLSPSATVSNARAFVWGQYRPSTKDLLIVDHGDVFDDQSASPVLLHEFIHVLQDREIDLQAFQDEHATSYESFLAGNAMIEGEARLYQTRYAASALGLDPGRVDWNEQFENTLQADEMLLENSASPYDQTFGTFSYEWGARYMNFTLGAGGRAAVLARFASPPATTHTLLASSTAALDPETPPAPLAAPTLAAAGYTEVTETSLGAWGLLLLLTRATPGYAQVSKLAVAWQADRLWVYAGSEPAPSTAVVWRIELADAEDANAIAAIARSVLGLNPSSVTLEGTGLVIAMSTQAGELGVEFPDGG